MKPNQAQNKAFDAIIPYINAANIDYGATMLNGEYIIRSRVGSVIYIIAIRPDATVYFMAFKGENKIAEKDFDLDGAHCARYFLEQSKAKAK